mgnify:CR=1 FL=1
MHSHYTCKGMRYFSVYTRTKYVSLNRCKKCLYQKSTTVISRVTYSFTDYPCTSELHISTWYRLYRLQVYQEGYVVCVRLCIRLSMTKITQSCMSFDSHTCVCVCIYIMRELIWHKLPWGHVFILVNVNSVVKSCSNPFLKPTSTEQWQ